MTISEIDGNLHSDQTGYFPVTSNRGNCYVPLVYTVDSNYNKSYSLKSRHCSELLKSYDNVYAFLHFQGHWPQLHKRNNDTPKDVEEYIAEQQAKVKYPPADIHRTNITKRCIRT